MRSSISTCIRKRIESTVRALCPIIENQVCTRPCFPWTECTLRRELVGCILGSQVRHEMATTALNRLEQAGLLDDGWWHSTDDMFECRVFDVLSGHTPQCHSSGRYRFPKVRAHQLAEARNAVAARSLSERLSDISDPKQIRQRLATELSGLGPKQASMFLRNIGRSYDLAILDTHVLHYMDMQRLLCLKHTNIGSVPAYERTERIVVNYADKLGYPAGYLDWAIWATMRAARALGL